MVTVLGFMFKLRFTDANLLFQYEEFEKYLKNLSLSTAARTNPWFPQLYQAKKENCSLRGDFSVSKNYSLVCNLTEKIGADYGTVDIYAVNMIKALYAFGYGLKSFCLSLSCQKLYTRNQNNAEELRKELGKIKIPASDDSREATLKPFDNQLDGTAGYTVYSQIKKDKLEYVKVYTFNKTDEITLKTRCTFYKYKAGKDETLKEAFDGMHCTSNCTKYCEDNANVPIIILSVALSFVSMALAAILLRAAWRKYGGGK